MNAFVVAADGGRVEVMGVLISIAYLKLDLPLYFTAEL